MPKDLSIEHHAGGDDFDNIIVDWLMREYLQAVDCTEPIMIARLKGLAEKAKARANLTSICLPYVDAWMLEGNGGVRPGALNKPLFCRHF